MSLLTQNSPRLPVLIIGAGIGGLTLAHSLAKHDIPYRLFERDAEPFSRTQGYRFTLNKSGASALKMATVPEVFEEFVGSCGESHSAIGRVDARTGLIQQGGVLGMLGSGGWGMIGALLYRYGWTLWQRVGSTPPTPVVPLTEKSHSKVDRQTLRTILLESQTDKITFNASFSSYTMDEKSVMAHFIDGTSVAGSLLVGADGIRSKVAQQLTGGQAAPIDLGPRIIYGKTPLTPKIEKELLPILQKGFAFIRDDKQGVLVVFEVMRFNHTRAPGDYVFWAATTKAETVGLEDDDFVGSQGTAAAEIMLRLSKDWDPRIRVVFEEHQKENTAVVKLTSSHPEGLPNWETEPRVTVLGDAIHCMPPTGGQGANTALHDAAALGQILSDEEVDEMTGAWSKETIERFEKVVKWNIGDVVALACIGANWLLGAKAISSL